MSDGNPPNGFYDPPEGWYEVNARRKEPFVEQCELCPDFTDWTAQVHDMRLRYDNGIWLPICPVHGAEEILELFMDILTEEK